MAGDNATPFISPLPTLEAMAAIVKECGLPVADLSSVPDPKGRIDFLASRLIAKGVEAYAPQLAGIHKALSPVVDGLLVATLGDVQVPVFGDQTPATQRRTNTRKGKKK
jgi:hypothetical protein